MAQILLKLVPNATQYKPPSGQISVSTAVREQEQKTRVTFTVKDSSRGIGAQDLSHLLERFFRGEAG